ncbi:MAG: YciI family protein [Parvibaculaceae bacterium]
MLYVVILTDNADRVDERTRLMPAHLNFLEQNRDHIRAAGPLFETNGAGAGGLWLVDAASPDAVTNLVRSDPFWPTGLRKEVRVLQWSQVFAEGRRVGSKDQRV